MWMPWNCRLVMAMWSTPGEPKVRMNSPNKWPNSLGCKSKSSSPRTILEPTHFYTLQLLQRNYQIARKANTIYAFGILEPDHKRVKGGTGWTVQLAMDQGKPVYLFDIPSQTWYRSDHYYQVNENAATLVTGSQFVPWGPKKPTLHQSSAIVGSRDVDEKTRAEIQALFNRTFCLPENIDQLRMELEDFHL